MEAIETYEHEGVSVEIHYDQDASDFCNPRGNDGNLTTMVCWHPDYVLGDEQLSGSRGAVETPFDASGEVRSMRHLYRYLTLMRGTVCVLPLYLYDHSGISISAGSVNPFDNPTVRSDEFGRGMGWDTSMIGFVYTTRERIEELCGGPQIDTDEVYCPRLWPEDGRSGENWPRERSAMEWIQTQVQAEVKEYDSYLRGEVYGFIVDNDGPDEDACWGFVGDIDYCKEAANESAECAAQARAERRRKRGRSLHRGGFVTAGGTAS